MTDSICNIVQKTTQKCGTRDPYRISEQLGINFIRAELPDAVRGFFLALNGERIIVISDSLSEPEAAFCIAHELGHALLHNDLNFFFLRENTNFAVGRYEREADLFAAYLLAGEYPMYGDDTVTSEKVSAMTGVPIHLVEDIADVWKPHDIF